MHKRAGDSGTHSAGMDRRYPLDCPQNPRNGSCLNRLHGAAFDQGMISFDDDLRMNHYYSIKALITHDSVRSNFHP